ncbi:MAG: hypothetical protein PHQ43_01210 [Dehalococcoidales bacterium]|nr:hypothetical protein [Dehalococcoidales bacterium]
MIQPGELVMVFVVTGIAGLLTYVSTRVASTKITTQLEPADWLPAAPPNPPVPRFIVEQPELINKTREEL